MFPKITKTVKCITCKRQYHLQGRKILLVQIVKTLLMFEGTSFSKSTEGKMHLHAQDIALGSKSDYLSESKSIS